jgi:hypothetical protein
MQNKAANTASLLIHGIFKPQFRMEDMVEYIIPAFGSTRPGPSDHWHLDEMVIVIRRKRY